MNTQIHLVLLNFIVVVVTSRKVTKCEFATELKKQLPSDDWERNLGDWICVAEGIAELETSKSTASENPSESHDKSYGLFQISNQWWCEDETSRVNINFDNLCKTNCTFYIDDDIKDDITCAIQIQKAGEQRSVNRDWGANWRTWGERCQGKDMDRYKHIENCSATIQPVAPMIDAPANSTIILNEGSVNKYIECHSSIGVPVPKLTWDYDRNASPELISQTPTTDTLRLIFPTAQPYHAGPYICVAENFYGVAKQTFTLKIGPKVAEAGVPYGVAIGVPLAILVVIGLLVVHYFRRVLQKLDGLSKAEIDEFVNGCPDKIKANGLAHENIQFLPYNKDYDIPKEKLKCEYSKILGEGQYGYVTKAELDGTPVAVKAVKPHTDKVYIKALLSELKIMIYLGKHGNIVSLVGAITDELDKGNLQIVVEFCPHGDLQNYLRNRKTEFLQGIAESHQNAVITQYENTMAITIADLVKWCQQIAEGMDYLATKKVIHGDLAARNVLLTSNFGAKITDFGLSRQLYDYTNYVKKQQAPLPWRHMAIESLKEMSFSTSSDVWSFGVTMWEIFSFGDVPYPGRSWSLDFVQELEGGLRLLQPKYTPDFMYEIMKNCWDINPNARPSFESLVELCKIDD